MITLPATTRLSRAARRVAPWLAGALGLGGCSPIIVIDGSPVELEVVEARTTSTAVPAPDYELDVSGLGVVTDVDLLVQSVTGVAELTSGAVLGQSFVVVDISGLATFAEIDEAYVGGDEVPVTLTIAAETFGLVGDDLTAGQVRTLIVANVATDIRSYQSFEVVFHAPH